MIVIINNNTDDTTTNNSSNSNNNKHMHKSLTKYIYIYTHIYKLSIHVERITYVYIYINKQNRHASVDTHIPIPQATGKLLSGLLVSLGLDNFLDTVSRRPETVATRAGLRLYDVPPGKYPEEMEGMLKLFFWGKEPYLEGKEPYLEGKEPYLKERTHTWKERSHTWNSKQPVFSNWFKNRFPCKDLESHWKQPVVNGYSRL